MIQLIQNIQGNFVTEIKSEVNYVHGIQADIQREDYVNIYGFTAFLQNLSQTPKTSAFVVPNLFGYTPPVSIKSQTVSFSTCNRTARWYNMQERPEYLMGLKVGLYPGSQTVIFTIENLLVNGTEYITTPLSASVNTLTANWVRANNNIVYDLTGSTTGWTYTDFVDFLNYTFNSNGLNYEAKISYETIDVNSNSDVGFYLIYPENDDFILKTSSNSGFNIPLTYTNEGVSSAYNTYVKSTTDYFTYDCETNTITE